MPDFPAEVLSKIFLALKNDTLPSRRWIRVSHVSQLWRRVALGYPALWSDVSLDNPHVNVWIKRSGRSRLSADLTTKPGSTEKAMLALIENSYRFKTLEVG